MSDALKKYPPVIRKRSRSRKDFLHYMRDEWELYLVFSVPLGYILLFHYVPMYGVQIAFRDYSPAVGIFGSDWVGLGHFIRFFSSIQVGRVIGNTVSISFYGLVAGFPFPIILAIALNYAGNRAVKKSVQLITYMPYFISTVVMVAILLKILEPRVGPVNLLISRLGGEEINFLGEARLFSSIYVWSGIWQSMGYSAIIYLAALAGVDVELHEAAIVDGATKLQRIARIDLPCILPTITIILIFQIASIMNIGFEKIYLMQNPLNLRASEVIATYVYKVGLIQADYSFGAAVGLFNNIVGFLLLITTNQAAKRVGATSLW